MYTGAADSVNVIKNRYFLNQFYIIFTDIDLRISFVFSSWVNDWKIK